VASQPFLIIADPQLVKMKCGWRIATYALMATASSAVGFKPQTLKTPFTLRETNQHWY